jgi:CO dehydrogenase maturation factor
MKIAITGKGGAGKTTLASVLARLYSDEGRKVIAVDADPDANLASALGVPREDALTIRPLAEMETLIEERTGARPGVSGGMFRLNPAVEDLPEGVGYAFEGIILMTMGKPKAAASGCYCPENVLLRSLLRHLMLRRSDVVIVDMEAGIEHLSRGTSENVDCFIVVVEPGHRSLQTAATVFKMAEDLGVKKTFVVANKVRGDADLDFIRANIGGIEIAGVISFSDGVMEADIRGTSPYVQAPETVREVRVIKQKIEERMDQLNETG